MNIDEQVPKRIMKRTEILCPNCFKGKVIQTTEKEAYCDQCGQEYHLKLESNQLRFK